MAELKKIFEYNRDWSEQLKEKQPDFFRNLAKEQNPEYLWIGCSDSRVSSSTITGVHPGEMFVHRNIANQVVPDDLNVLSVIQFAVDVLKVKHIIVCGHYGCGGVVAALSDEKLGLIDNWLEHIKGVYRKYREKIDVLADKEAKVNLLCELNVLQQVKNIAQTETVSRAWERGQKLAVHGVIYSISDGLIRDLRYRLDGTHDLTELENKY